MGQAAIIVVEPEDRRTVRAHDLGGMGKLPDEADPKRIVGMKSKGPSKTGHSSSSDSVQVDDFSVGHRFRV